MGAAVVITAICAFAWYKVKTHNQNRNIEGGRGYNQDSMGKRPATGEMVSEVDTRGMEQTGVDPVHSRGYIGYFSGNNARQY